MLLTMVHTRIARWRYQQSSHHALNSIDSYCNIRHQSRTPRSSSHFVTSPGDMRLNADATVETAHAILSVAVSDDAFKSSAMSGQ
jgi:hypothetical protein